MWLDRNIWCIIHLNGLYADVAQLAEQLICNQQVIGSSPTGGVLGNEYLKFNLWLHGQAVKTPPFHGGNRGSNPLGVINL